MTLKPIDYDDSQHRNYARGRPLHATAADMWMHALAAHAPDRRPLHVLDLGCGTGRFSPMLAEVFGSVTGIEPSERMREAAGRENFHPRVHYLAGRAEAIPLADASVDLVLMMLSYHHVRDRAAAAQEIARVLKPDGRLCIRSVFSDRMPVIDWHRFFPSADAVERAMFPTTDQVETAFAQAGLRPMALERHREQISESWAETAARMKLRPISTFEHLDEAEILAGQAALEAYAAAETSPTPLFIDADLMVLARG
ncbi:methyltransferase domain-containing protein [Brevundimonas sp. 2R-24]|uniref:Methyltransferase domain-containing protein n=1 Tax=Peiella sedimenti TaxID=3061083 RepID=A0ABT8SMS6_9CAUL|nr:methyltransferase domain-containing protein [Caulobacteraceae bacterium XZ-24]